MMLMIMFCVQESRKEMSPLFQEKWEILYKRCFRCSNLSLILNKFFKLNHIQIHRDQVLHEDHQILIHDRILRRTMLSSLSGLVDMFWRCYKWKTWQLVQLVQEWDSGNLSTHGIGIGSGTGIGSQTFLVAAMTTPAPNLTAYLNFLRYRRGMWRWCADDSSIRKDKAIREIQRMRKIDILSCCLILNLVVFVKVPMLSCRTFTGSMKTDPWRESRHNT